MGSYALGDKLFHILNLSLLLIVRLCLIDIQLCLGLNVGIIISLVIDQLLLVIQIDNVCADIVEEIFRM